VGLAYTVLFAEAACLSFGALWTLLWLEVLRRGQRTRRAHNDVWGSRWGQRGTVGLITVVSKLASARSIVLRLIRTLGCPPGFCLVPGHCCSFAC